MNSFFESFVTSVDNVQEIIIESVCSYGLNDSTVTFDILDEAQSILHQFFRNIYYYILIVVWAGVT